MTRGVPEDLLDGEHFIASLENVYGAATAQEIVAQLWRDNADCYWLNPLVDVPFDPVGEPLVDLPEVFVAPVEARISESPAASSGRIYLQNPSSYFAVKVLGPQPGEEVLDLAAAPGGKTIAIAAMMGNTGRIGAVEPVKPRFHRLRANLERCGVTNVDLYMRDGRTVGRAVGERFDRVLLDAPCSSEARMRWFDRRTYAHWGRRKVKEATRKQKALIRSAYDALKPGGTLVYSTCSFAYEENEGVVHHLVRKTDAVIETIEEPAGRSLPGVVGEASKLARTLRILPDDTWQGFYVAKIVKPG